MFWTILIRIPQYISSHFRKGIEQYWISLTGNHVDSFDMCEEICGSYTKCLLSADMQEVDLNMLNKVSTFDIRIIFHLLSS